MLVRVCVKVCESACRSGQMLMYGERGAREGGGTSQRRKAVMQMRMRDPGVGNKGDTQKWSHVSNLR